MHRQNYGFYRSLKKRSNSCKKLLELTTFGGKSFHSLTVLGKKLYLYELVFAKIGVRACLAVCLVFRVRAGWIRFVSFRAIFLERNLLSKFVKLNAWVQDFLFNRPRFIIFDHFSSDTVPVTSGVPQNSVLGPLLFLVDINDITSNIDCKIKLFSDDSIIYREINTEQYHLSFNKSLNTVAEWCSHWQMTINVKKNMHA